MSLESRCSLGNTCYLFVASMDVRIVYLKLLFCVVFISLTLFVYVTFFCFFNVLFTLSWLFVPICNYVCPMSVLLFLSSQIDCCCTLIYFPLVSELLRSFVQIDTLPNNVLIECLLYGDKNLTDDINRSKLELTLEFIHRTGLFD